MFVPGIPIALRVVNRAEFVRGPFHLGSLSYPIAIGAVIWILFISIAFILPQVNVSYKFSLASEFPFDIDCPASELANSQLRHRGGGNCHHLQRRLLAYQRTEVVCRAD